MTTTYLLDGRTEDQRLRLQSLVWEPAARALLARLGADRPPRPLRVLDLGCGCLGWLRVLSEYVGPRGEVVGTDVDRDLLSAARRFCDEQGLTNVTLVEDDLFRSRLEPASFDLVHARFQVAPLGRGPEVVAAMSALAAPGGRLVLEDPDSSSWRLHPAAPATEALVRLVVNAFRRGGGDFDAGRSAPGLLRAVGGDVSMTTEVIALESGHPYLSLPLQFADSLAARLGTLTDQETLAALRAEAAAEIEDPDRWGTTFTLVQAVATVASDPV